MYDDPWDGKLFVPDMAPDYNLRIHTGTFWTNLPNKVSIAVKTPADFTGPFAPDIHPAGAALVPPPNLVWRFKNGEINWNQYVVEFSSHLRREAAAAGITPEYIYLEETIRDICLKIQAVTGFDEITLCCWEGPKNPQCHRKYIYDHLPKDMRGIKV